MYQYHDLNFPNTTLVQLKSEFRRKLRDKSKKSKWLIGVSPLALAACGGESETSGTIKTEMFETQSYQILTTSELQDLASADGLPEDGYVVSGTFDELLDTDFELEIVNQNAPERLDVSGNLNLDAAYNPFVAFEDKIHFVGAELNFSDPDSTAESVNIVVRSNSDLTDVSTSSSGHLVLREGSSIAMVARDLSLNVGFRGQDGELDVYEGSSISIVQTGIKDGDEYPLATLNVGNRAGGEMTMNGVDTNVTVTGHRGNVNVGYDSNGTLTVENGAKLEIIADDQAAVSSPEARLIVGYGDAADNIGTADGSMLIQNQAEVVLSGHRSNVIIGHQQDAIGNLEIAKGGQLSLINEQARPDEYTSSVIHVGYTWDDTPSGTGTLLIDGKGTSVDLAGDQYTALRVGDNGSTGSVTISNGASISMRTDWAVVPQDDWSGSQVRVGRGDGADATLLVTGAETRLDYAGIGTELRIADNPNGSAALSGSVHITNGAVLNKTSTIDASSTNQYGAYTYTQIGNNTFGGKAELVVSGSGSALTTSGETNWVNVASDGTSVGTLDVLDGGKAHFNFADQGSDNRWAGEGLLTVGSISDGILTGSAIVTVSGDGSEVHMDGEYTALMIGQNGTVDVSDGGKMILTNVDNSSASLADPGDIFIAGELSHFVIQGGQVNADAIVLNDASTIVGYGTLSVDTSVIVSDTAFYVGDAFNNEDGPNITTSEDTLDIVGDLDISGSSVFFSAGNDDTSDLIQVIGSISISGSTIEMSALNIGEYLVASATDGLTIDGTTTVEGGTLEIIDLEAGGQGLLISVTDII
jgi:hypothetical protein